MLRLYLLIVAALTLGQVHADLFAGDGDDDDEFSDSYLLEAAEFSRDPEIAKIAKEGNLTAAELEGVVGESLKNTE